MPSQVYRNHLETAQQPPPDERHDPDVDLLRAGQQIRNLPYEALADFQDAMNAAVRSVSARVGDGEIPFMQGARTIMALQAVQMSAGAERERRRQGEAPATTGLMPVVVDRLARELALERIRDSLSDRQISHLISRARFGDPELLRYMDEDNITVDDLRGLVRSGAS